VHAEIAYLFRHALLREAAYQLQMPADRARLHALSLEIMESVLADALDLFSEELADHARFAQSDQPDAALAEKERAYTKAAAKYAEDRFLNEKSASLWERAATLHPSRAEPRVAALSNAGRLWFRCGRPEEAARAFETGMAESADAGHEAALTLLQNRLSMLQSMGRYEEVLAQGPALVERANAAGKLSVALRVRYLLVNARIINAPDYSPVEEYEPIAAAAEKAGDMLLALSIRASHGNSLRNMQRPAEAQVALEHCVKAAKAAGLHHIGGIALGYLGHVFNQTDRFDEALKTYDDCLRIMREVGDQRFIAIFTSSRGTLLRKLNRLDEALSHYDVAQGILRELGAMEDLANVLMGRAMVEFARSNEPGWRNACAESEAISNKLNQPQRAEMARLKLAEIEKLAR
jgi:tetratricopeptide (TPR) repeat protein